MNLQPKLKKLREICQQNKISMLGVFGSVARGEDTVESDVDLLVRFDESPGLLDFIRLEDKFVEVLEKKVDLATEDSLHPLIRQNVLDELKILYEG
jgi:predicted nucleotidyltransferase